MKKIFLLIIILISFSSFSQSIKPLNHKDPCSECFTDPTAIDTSYYRNKIDSISKLIKLSEKENSELFRLRGDYYACMSKYNSKFDSIFIKHAFSDLNKAILIDSTNWLAYRTITKLYTPYLTFEKKELESALKYANLLIKYNDTIGDSYFTRALISILLNKLDSTNSDLKKAVKFNPCNSAELINTYESIYYLMVGKYSSCYKIVFSKDANPQLFDFTIGFVATQLISEFPFIKNSMITYLKQNPQIDISEKSFLIMLLKENYRFNELDSKEIENL